MDSRRNAIRRVLRNDCKGAFGWTGEPRDATTGDTHLRTRDYSPGTGRFTSRDRLIPNAVGTQGYNPSWYANGSPVTWTDPTGNFCAICVPVARETALRLQAMGQSLATRARADLSTYEGRRNWTLAAFALVAYAFSCLLNAFCRAGVSSVTGSSIDAVERAKEQTAEVAESVGDVHERIAEHLRSSRDENPNDEPDPRPTPEPIRPPGPVPLPVPTPESDCYRGLQNIDPWIALEIIDRKHGRGTPGKSLFDAPSEIIDYIFEAQTNPDRGYPRLNMSGDAECEVQVSFPRRIGKDIYTAASAKAFAMFYDSDTIGHVYTGYPRLPGRNLCAYPKG